VVPSAAPRPTRERPTTAGRVRASPAARRRAAELGLDLATIAGRGPGGAVVLADVEAAPSAVPARRHVHPVARKMAEVLGVDLATVPGTGTSGAVTKADVEAAVRRLQAAPAPEPAPAPVAAPRAAERGLRKALAAAMERANREIPHYYLATDVDLKRCLDWLEEANRRRPTTQRLLPAVLFLKAVALAARQVPEINGFWVDGAWRPGDGVHLGVAISRRTGEVVVPAIRDADRLDVGALMDHLRDLVQRARAGSLRSSEVSGATLTVTNLGDLGVAAVFGVIYPPQVALVGFGRVEERPRAKDGMLAVRPTVTLSLAADHRASDGYRGARFLAAVDALLQSPEKL
jgi:pyruvate dehydrogenase E2 component (dihydrolipoamide acetyltransferase)